MPAGLRYAIYFAPEQDTPLDRFGSHWLGRSAWDGATLAQPTVPQLSDGLLSTATESPRLYGFHATLKPPFRLQEGTTPEELERGLEELTGTTDAFEAPPLVLRRLGRFVALVLSEECAAIRAVADACVRKLDRFRAPASLDETERRKKAGLSTRQLDSLAAWGYPYVFDDWQFHMSLTGSLDASLLDRAQQALEPLVQSVTVAPLRVETLCLFEQPGPGLPFLVRRKFPLRNGGRF